MTPEQMRAVTDNFIAAHRQYQAELQVRCDEAEAALAAMLDVKVPE